MDREATSLALEQKYVYKVYDSIAPYFSHTRHKAWPRVAQFLEELPPGSLVADVGCGNGRYFGINKVIFTFGCDRCHKLVEAARDGQHEVMSCDNLRLPYRNNGFDAVISIGVIHHFTTVERRVEALRELARILQPGGRLMVYVWAMEQTRRKFDAQDVLVPWNMQTKHMKRKGKLLQQKDCLNHSTSSLSDDDLDHTTSDIPGFPPADNKNEMSKEKEKICQDIVSLVTMSKSQDRGATPCTTCAKLQGAQTLCPECSENCERRMILPNIELRSPSNPCPSDIQAVAADVGLSDVLKKTKQHGLLNLLTGSGASNTPVRLMSDTVLHDTSPTSSERKMSLPDRLKANLISILSPKSSSKVPKDASKVQSVKESQDVKPAKDYLYKQLIDHIVKNEAHIFDKPWPPVDSLAILPDGQRFQVREFPKSSTPLARQESTESALSFLHSRRNTEKGRSSSVDFASSEDDSSMSDDEESDDVFQETKLAVPSKRKLIKEIPEGEPENEHRKLTISKSVPANATNSNKQNDLAVSPKKNGTDKTLSNYLEKASRRCSADQSGDSRYFEAARKVSRGRIYSDPTPEIFVQKDHLSVPGADIRDHRDGYSADESSIDSSLLDLREIVNPHLPITKQIRNDNEEKPKTINGFSFPPPRMDVLEEKGSTEQSEKDQSAVEQLDIVTRIKHKKLHSIEYRRKLKRHSFELQALRRHMDNLPHVDQTRRSLPVVSTTKPIFSNGCIPELSLLTSVDASSAESLLDPKNDTDSDVGEAGPKSPTYHRYYHVFKDGELNGLITKYVPGLKVVDTYYDHANWCVIAEKVAAT